MGKEGRQEDRLTERKRGKRGNDKHGERKERKETVNTRVGKEKERTYR